MNKIARSTFISFIIIFLITNTIPVQGMVTYTGQESQPSEDKSSQDYSKTDPLQIKGKARIDQTAQSQGITDGGQLMDQPATEMGPVISEEGILIDDVIPRLVLVVDETQAMQGINFPVEEGLDLTGRSSSYNITYVAAGGTDPWNETCLAFPASAQTAFNYAASIWAATVNSNVPIAIRACWADLGSSSILGYSGGGYLYRDFSGAPVANTYYPSSLVNALLGYDINSSYYDMHITYNTNFSWYYGTDANPPSGTYDLVTVATHEIAHGLGFAGSATVSGANGYYGIGTPVYPIVYDRFMRDNSGTLLTSYSNPSAALKTLLTSDSLWWHGSNAMTANGGGRVKMYAPGTWSSGSSYSHLDYATFVGTVNSMMVYAISSASANHNTGPVTRGLLKDIGWPETPPIPTGVTASDGTYADRVQVSWTTSSGATFYQVYRNTTNTTSGATQLTASDPASPYDDTGAVSGTSYYYWVKACNLLGCSDYSASDNGYRAIAIPSAPTGVAASDGTYTDKVQVSWNVSSGATYYQVYRNNFDSTGDANQLTASQPASPYDDAGATEGIPYYYWVKACNAGGCSGFSSSNSGWRAYAIPATPTGVTASDGTYMDKVLVDWNDGGSPLNYELYRNTINSSTGASRIAAGYPVHPFDDTTAVQGTTYYYFVMACNPGGCSGFSVSDSGWRAYTIPAAPTGVAASDGTYGDKVQVSWNTTSGATYYQVYRNTVDTTTGATQLTASDPDSPYDDTTAVMGITYYFWVKACNPGGCSVFSSSDSGYRALIIPPAPTGVSASDGTFTDKVQVSWNASSDATHYKIYRNIMDTKTDAILLTDIDPSSPYDDTSAVEGTTYYYWVKACNTGAGCSTYSTSDSGWKAYTIPAAPTGVSASDGTYTDMVQLSWELGSGATFYQVYRNFSDTTSGESQLTASHPASPYNDTSATEGTTYYYWVKACNPGGCSGYSGSNSGWRAIAIPPAPTGVSATDGTYTNMVQITWNISSGATEYEVYRNTSYTTSGAILLGDSSGQTVYDDESASEGTTYYYWVKAQNSSGFSDFSSSDSGWRAIEIPEIPTGVSATDGTYTDKVQLTWNTSSLATYYLIYRNTSDTTSGATHIADSDEATPYDDTTALEGVTYYYWVKACKPGVCSGYSSSDSGWRSYTIPAAPTGVSATDGTIPYAVQVSWNVSSGATYYQVYRNTVNNSTGAAQLTASITSSPYDDENATEGTTLFYWLKACNLGGCSGYSSSDSGYTAIAVPPIPGSVTASDGTYADKVRISWNGSSSAAYYPVYRNTSNTTIGASYIGETDVSSYDDTTAIENTTYYYWVMACTEWDCSDYSSPDSGWRAIGVPEAPIGISASDGTYPYYVQVSWTASSGATYYQVYRNTSDTTGGSIQLATSLSTSPYDDSTALEGTIYYYWVKACSAWDCSPFSSSDSGYPALTIPPVPTDVAASDGTYTDKVRVIWVASSGATSYEVYRSTVNSTIGATLIAEPAEELMYDDTSAIVGSTYYYWVKACTVWDCSDYSSSDGGWRAYTIPAIPMGIIASDGTYPDKVQVSWEPDIGATYFQVYRNFSNTTAGAGQLTASHPASPYNDSTATEGTTYYYWVKACNPGGCSTYSASDGGWRAFTIPSAPTGVSATDGTYTDKVRVSWDLSANGTYYQVYRNTSDTTAEAETLTASEPDSHFDDTSAVEGMSYFYWVKACNSGGCSAYSSSDDGFRAVIYKNYLALIVNDFIPSPDSFQNGDFDTSSVGWTEYSTKSRDFILNTGYPEGDVPHSGSWAVWMWKNYDEISRISKSSTLHSDAVQRIYLLGTRPVAGIPAVKCWCIHPDPDDPLPANL
jgi:fibronectin type 3 domain-containing protein